MKPLRLMIGSSLMSWLATAALVGTRTSLDVLLGMIGPLVIAGATWVLMERTFARNPARLTSVMVMAFAAKIVFVRAYVAVMLKVVALRPVPFVASFTSYFIALHLMEAFCLRRLFSGRHA